MSRKIARERAFKILFAIDIGENTLEDAQELVVPHLADEKHKKFIFKEVQGVLKNIIEIDNVINKFSSDWAVTRMAAADRNILRLAVYEILFSEDIPISVAINEAVEIAKKYCDEHSYKFVNGLLGSIAKEKPVEQ